LLVSVDSPASFSEDDPVPAVTIQEFSVAAGRRDQVLQSGAGEAPAQRGRDAGTCAYHWVPAASCVRARMTAVPCGAQDVGMRSGRAAVAAVAVLGVAAFVVLCVADGTDRPPGGCLP